MEYQNKFKENLKELRVEKKIGQVELAKAAGISKGIKTGLMSRICIRLLSLPSISTFRLTNSSDLINQ